MILSTAKFTERQGPINEHKSLIELHCHYSENNPSLGHFVHKNSHKDWPGIERESPL